MSDDAPVNESDHPVTPPPEPVEEPETGDQTYIVYTDDKGKSHRIKRTTYHAKGL